ncbi:glycerol ethanol, ferric requiring protein, partial [Teratosphaeriaceae sp. CCFEE 6253]
MIRRISSISIHSRSPATPTRRSSYATSVSSRRNEHLTRRVSALSTAENGDVVDPEATAADETVAEELAEIKRYEDFTTIDWVQDAARENQRRKARRVERAGFFERDGRLGWRHKVWEAYDAGQGWIV